MSLPCCRRKLSGKSSEARIDWFQAHREAALLINDPHAAFDFKGKQGYCRSGFPPAVDNGWSTKIA